MNFKLIVAVLAIAAVPVYAQAQAPNPPKPSKPAKAAPAAPVTKAAAAQKLVKTISGDKAKTQTYCDSLLSPDTVSLAPCACRRSNSVSRL